MSETAHTYTDFALKMTRGDELILDLTVTRIPAGGSEEPQNLAGGMLVLTGKLKLSDPDEAAVFQLTSNEGGGVDITDPAGGLAQARISPGATASLPDTPSKLHVDCCWVDGSGNPHTFQTGTIRVYPDVTRG